MNSSTNLERLKMRGLILNGILCFLSCANSTVMLKILSYSYFLFL
jgi:hypothetical protein